MTLSCVPLTQAAVALDALNAGLQAYIAAGGLPLPEDEHLLDYLLSAARFGQMQAEIAVLEANTPRARAVGLAAWHVDGTMGLLHFFYLLPDAPPEIASRFLTHVLRALHTPAVPTGIFAELPVLQPPVREALHAAGFVGVQRLVLALALDGQAWRVTPPPGYAVRAWRDTDLPAAARIIHAANVGTLDALIIPELRTLPTTQRIVEQTLYGRYGTFDRAASAVALHAGEIVGVTLVTRRRAGEGFTAEICVEPEQQRRGLGQTLLSHTHAALSAAGLCTATLGVTAGNPARDLYERVGYRQTGSVWTYLWPQPPGWPGAA